MEAPADPRYWTESFVCPQCGVNSMQYWQNPVRLTEGAYLSHGPLGYGPAMTSLRIDYAMCISCRKYSVWLEGQEVYPLLPSVQRPHEDMPAEVILLYWEAAFVARHSPRAAAVLVRCALQMLLSHMGKSTGKLMHDIQELEKAGFDGEVIKALDLVRLLGDDGAHPEQIMLGQTVKDTDDLFFLLNFIADAQFERLRARRKVAEMHDGIPDKERSYIADRQRGSERAAMKRD